MTLNLELQKSECPTGRQFKSWYGARLDERWCHKAMVLDYEVHYCSGFASRGPTPEFSIAKRRKQWATIRIRWLCARSALETAVKSSNVTRSEHNTVVTGMICSTV